MVSQPLPPKNSSLKLAGLQPRIRWGACDPLERGAIVGTVTNPKHRNVIGTHGGSYSVYRALAVATGQLSPDHRSDLSQTEPIVQIPPNPAWCSRRRIVSLDPWGARVTEVFAPLIVKEYNIQPTIAITQAHLNLPEVQQAMTAGRLQPDGLWLLESGDVRVTKVAIDPVWYLPGVAERLGVAEATLRQALHHQTGGMFPELISRPDLKIWLPPIGGTTVYILGEVAAIGDLTRSLTVRIHDECNGSDVFGSDICTCRPYLMHGIEECIQTAQAGGTGLVVYFRKEGRALGEVTKYLVYNARKRSGDRADGYFERTECVAGVQDARFQALMPDVLHWLGVQRIDRLVSMSDMKYQAIVESGITVVERVPLPDDRIPADAWVEMEAKKAAGYYTVGETPTPEDLQQIRGRHLESPKIT
ncbi:GTP cyclohydrolase II [Alkalinema sp. FACHB-956]|uniref:GTP cyclohydrolase II n=1 Tax=Alkalinema sp. FACHB-956 TaxID=2692768 RepID=UPI0016834A0F|nr:GTP cyclohydrolase II [Alkalinema sp. FACHB-956]MBD2328147.1 GTP cyclohydrolase II [Alkalinema sp. FACHB-956]